MTDNWSEPNLYEISNQTLEKILHYSSDDIFVLDGEQRILYVNPQCCAHFGLNPSDVIGKHNSEFAGKYWRPSIMGPVFEKKKPVTMIQTTYIGSELITTAVPIFNQEQEIELVVITSSELQTYRTLFAGENESYPVQSDPIQHPIITENKKMKDLLGLAKKVANVNSTVLIHGESGTGKGLIANYIHNISERKNHSFLTINCAAIPEELLESELFGYAPGAFTGANKQGKKGLIESANHGTVLLDEIGEISLKVQAKLLQLLEDHQFIPVGGHDLKKVDVRLIAATNQNLEELVEEKKFREDLYYRLNVIELEVLPLRKRREDIIPLAHYFLNQFNKKYRKALTISGETLHILTGYSWPGNVRQLSNVIERSVVMADSIIEPVDLPHLIHKHAKPVVQVFSYCSLDETLKEVEKNLILDSYKRNPSSRKVAEDLKISQTKASKLIRKYT